MHLYWPTCDCILIRQNLYRTFTQTKRNKISLQSSWISYLNILIMSCHYHSPAYERVGTSHIILVNLRFRILPRVEGRLHTLPILMFSFILTQVYDFRLSLWFLINVMVLTFPLLNCHIIVLKYCLCFISQLILYARTCTYHLVFYF